MYGGRPVGKLRKVVKLFAADTDPPPNEYLFMGPFLCQSYHILSTICITHVSEVREGCGRTTNRMVHEEQWIIWSPFWSRETVWRDRPVGTEASQVAGEIGQRRTPVVTNVPNHRALTQRQLCGHPHEYPMRPSISHPNRTTNSGRAELTCGDSK